MGKRCCVIYVVKGCCAVDHVTVRADQSHHGRLQASAGLRCDHRPSVLVAELCRHSYKGPQYHGARGHPNSFVARSVFTKTPAGLVSYDKNPLEDRFGRLSRTEGLVAVIAQMVEHPQCERIQRLGCYTLAHTSASSWTSTLKTTYHRWLALTTTENSPSRRAGVPQLLSLQCITTPPVRGCSNGAVLHWLRCLMAAKLLAGL